jgi:hypothetical protein
MDTAQVEADLRARIEQSEAWLSDNPTPITDIRFRNRTWRATPVEFLNDSTRVERSGLKFELALDDPARVHKVQLNVRIKPEASIGSKEDSPPYVVIYVVNQATGADDAITWQKISVPTSYADLVGLSIEEWYRKWLNYALVSKAAKKIFSPAMKLPE